MTQDVLLSMFDELRTSRPPVWDCDAWQGWLLAVGQTIAALPDRQAFACMALLANDLAQAFPGMPIEVAYAAIRQAVQQAGSTERTQ